MKKFLIIMLLVTGSAKADMYYECLKQSETEPINATSSAPQAVELDIAQNYSLRLNGKKEKFQVIDEKRDYRPVLQTGRMHLGELEIATYSFDGRKCDSTQEGTLTRVAQIGAEDVTETAQYACTCAED